MNDIEITYLDVPEGLFEGDDIKIVYRVKNSNPRQSIYTDIRVYIDGLHLSSNHYIGNIGPGQTISKTIVKHGLTPLKMPGHDSRIQLVVQPQGLAVVSSTKTIVCRCEQGKKRDAHTCWDSSVIHSEVCHNNRWVPTGEACSRPVCRFENVAHEIRYVQWRGQYVLRVFVTAVNTSPDPNPVCNIELMDNATGKVLAKTGVVIFGGGSSRVELQVIPAPTSALNYTLYGRMEAVHYGGPYDFKISSSFTPEEARKHAEMIAESKRRAEEAARISAEEEEARRIAEEVVYLPKAKCAEGDKKPGYICSEGNWIPYTPPDVSAADVRIAAEEEARRIEEEAVYLPKAECTEGDKKPGYICSGGKWVPYTPEPGAGRLYVKLAVPWLDLLPGIPYEPWMWIPPGFKVVEESR